mgnify:CR=1 FL=1|jgi:Zn-dependent protease/predicted transcriptional regulator
MNAQIKLGRIFGIEIGLHYSWLIIAVLIVLSLAGYFGAAHPDWSAGVIWAMAVFSAVMFFLAIITHELSHAQVARMNGLPVRSITLFALGGVAQIEKEAASAKTEFWMAIAGPIASVVIGLTCLGLALAAGWTPPVEPATPIMSILVWLGYINIALAVFNMIPGFPMDGGRVLRALIWWATGDSSRATRGASTVGQLIAFGFILFGLVSFFRGAGLGGLWIAFIGWFLLNAARATYAQVAITEGLRGVTVGDLMSRDCPAADINTNLQTLLEEHLLKTGRRCYMVTEKGVPVGLITPHEIKSVERQMWGLKTLGEVMKPIEELHTVEPATPAGEALEIIGREDVNQLPVISDGRLEGIISRDLILRYLVTRQELDLLK